MEDKILNSFLGSAKESLNKQNSLNRYYSTYHTGVDLHQYIIK